MGVLADQAEQHLAGFLLRMRRGWGQITLKVAASLDGRVAMATGESQWITCETSRQDVQRLRAESDLIVTGIGTVLADDCQLTLRPDQSSLSSEESERALRSPPHRMVLDSQGRTPVDARVLKGAPTTVITAPGIEMDVSITQHQLPVDQGGRIVLDEWVHYLGAQSFNNILIEHIPPLFIFFLSLINFLRLFVFVFHCPLFYFQKKKSRKLKNQEIKESLFHIIIIVSCFMFRVSCFMILVSCFLLLVSSFLSRARPTPTTPSPARGRAGE